MSRKRPLVERSPGCRLCSLSLDGRGLSQLQPDAPDAVFVRDDLRLAGRGSFLTAHNEDNRVRSVLWRFQVDVGGLQSLPVVVKVIPLHCGEAAAIGNAVARVMFFAKVLAVFHTPLVNYLGSHTDPEVGTHLVYPDFGKDLRTWLDENELAGDLNDCHSVGIQLAFAVELLAQLGVNWRDQHDKNVLVLHCRRPIEISYTESVFSPNAAPMRTAWKLKTYYLLVVIDADGVRVCLCNHSSFP